MFELEFLSPQYFAILILIPILVYFDLKQANKWIKLRIIDDLKAIKSRSKMYFWLNILFKSIIILIFALILAWPNIWNVKQSIKKNWIDIIVALDISTSMLEQDIKPNRIEWAKKVIWDFSKNLEGDRMWILLFAGKPFLSSPLTFDYTALSDYIMSISTDTIDQHVYWLQWTAIWDALLVWIHTYQKDKEKNPESKDRQKVIILLSDGVANVWANPIAAARVAGDEGIKIYTIWIWTPGNSYATDMFWRQIKIEWLDENGLNQIAQITWGSYFNASSLEVLSQIFDRLSKLEKREIKVEVVKEYSSKYKPFLYLLIVLLVIYSLFRLRYKVIT